MSRDAAKAPLDVRTCKAPVSLLRSQEGFQLGRLLKIEVEQPGHVRSIEWQRSANVPLVWLVKSHALAWVNGTMVQTPKKPLAPDESGEAAELFREWSAKDATKAWTIKLANPAHRWSWYRVGSLVKVDYGSTKWTGKYTEYTHDVERGTTMYCANISASQQLCLCKGRLTITADGLEN